MSSAIKLQRSSSDKEKMKVASDPTRRQLIEVYDKDKNNKLTIKGTIQRNITAYKTLTVVAIVLIMAGAIGIVVANIFPTYREIVKQTNTKTVLGGGGYLLNKRNKTKRMGCVIS